MSLVDDQGHVRYVDEVMHPTATLTIDGGRASLPSSVFDHGGFRAWATSEHVAEQMRVAFIDGEVLIEMSPEATETHNKPKRTVAAVLGNLVEELDLGEAYTDGVLLTHPEANLSTEPDFVFVSWQSFESGRVHLIEKAGRTGDYVELVGTPDLVVEIVSDTSVRKDSKLLYDSYRRAGVPEYWLIDARGQNISFQILQLHGAAFRPAAPNDQPQRSDVLAATFKLERVTNRLGRWRYRLDVIAR